MIAGTNLSWGGLEAPFPWPIPRNEAPNAMRATTVVRHQRINCSTTSDFCPVKALETHQLRWLHLLQNECSMLHTSKIHAYSSASDSRSTSPTKNRNQEQKQQRRRASQSTPRCSLSTPLISKYASDSRRNPHVAVSSHPPLHSPHSMNTHKHVQIPIDTDRHTRTQTHTDTDMHRHAQTYTNIHRHTQTVYTQCNDREYRHASFLLNTVPTASGIPERFMIPGVIQRLHTHAAHLLHNPVPGEHFPVIFVSRHRAIGNSRGNPNTGRCPIHYGIRTGGQKSRSRSGKPLSRVAGCVLPEPVNGTGIDFRCWFGGDRRLGSCWVGGQQHGFRHGQCAGL